MPNFELLDRLTEKPRVERIIETLLDEPYGLAGAARAAELFPNSPVEALERYEEAARDYDSQIEPSAPLPEGFSAMSFEERWQAVGRADLAADILRSAGFPNDSLLLESLCCRGVRYSAPPPKTPQMRLR